MKTFTLPAILIAALSIAGFNSCKKITAIPKTVTSTSQTNPKTAVIQCDYDVDDTAFTNHGWTKSFDDEFTGDLSNWTAYTGGVQNELQYYQPANATIVGGALQLSAQQQTISGTSYNGSPQTFNYTSASIVSNQTFSANSGTPKLMIVARVKVAGAYGLTSIFESFGSNWPTNGQINFLQVEGNDTKEYVTNYFYGTTAGQNQVQNGMYFDQTNGDLSACWHVFSTIWTQNSLSYYLDGQLVETKTGSEISGLFGKEEVLSFNLPIGGLYYQNLNTANIQTGAMYIDYVKTFTSK